VDRCAEVRDFFPQYAAVVDRWVQQDDLEAGPPAPVVFVGSSSVRRWEGLARAYADRTPLQRGFGGAQLGEVALHTSALVTRHDPRVVVVYAGTNDVAAGVDAPTVVERFRCFRQRVGNALGWDRPVLFVAITPNPARWSSWSTAAAVNDGVASLVAGDPGLRYVDVATPFLATGSPPAGRLFVADGLHLSEEGYALWNSVLRPAVEAATSATPPAGPPPVTLAAGTRVLVDLGPSNPEDGEWTPSPDHLGQHWNNWHALPGGAEVLPGEHLGPLHDDQGAPTGMGIVVTGGFACNGRRNGGLLWPHADRLGNLAVGSATGDFFYAGGDDLTGGLYLRGLDPARTYTLRLFGARDDPERRVTTYQVWGAQVASAVLQTSGPGAGSNGLHTNDDDTAVLAGLRPDPWGHLFLDLQQTEGAYAYLSVLEVVVE
jgi:hypothetical protein